jgi:undecaprenyl diphosphate synthase
MTAYSNTCLVDDARRIFTLDEASLIDQRLSPKHVAIIMDGNRRWAKQKGLSPLMGHWEGAETLVDIVRAGAELGIQKLTVYSFSTENWERTNAEVDALMNLFELHLINKEEWMCKEGVRLETIGDLTRLPKRLQDVLTKVKESTQGGKKITLILALNYGARDEIRRAVTAIVKKNISPEGITEELIADHLDTKAWGDPDLLIRTSGELRVSNFLLWQISYAEIYITETLWPDFSAQNLYQAILSFQHRQRRKGS